MKSLRNLLQASKSVFIRVFCGMLIASSGVLFAESKSYEGETGTPAFQWGTIGGAAYYSHGGVLGPGSSLFKGYDELKFSLCSADIAGGAIADVNWGYGYSNWDGYAVSAGRPCSVEFKNISNLIFENNRVGSYDASLYVKAGGYISVPSKYIEESCGYGDFRCGSGGAIFANVNLSKCQNVLFQNNVAKGSGGAIYGDFTFKGDGVSQQQVLTFSHNKAIHGGGGALYTSGSNGCTITSVSKITFESNAARYGGAYVQSGARLALEACGDVLFNSNIATEYGGAVYGNNGLYFNSNSSLAFKDNYARLEGSAIYSTSGIHIQGNLNVLVENNSSSNNDAAAIYCGSTLTISGNGNVEFRNNGFAFRSVTADISASTYVNSNVKIYDSFEVTTLNLNKLAASYTLAAGTVLLSGKASVGTVSGAATLNYGTLSLADGAVMHVGTDMKVNNKNAHITLEQGTKLDVEGSLTLSSSTYLQFSLDKAQGNTTPMVLADKVTLSSSPFKLSWLDFDEQSAPASLSTHALMEVGSSLTYKNTTYIYQDAVWWQGGEMKSTAEMNLLFPEQNNLSYFWNGNLLCVRDSADVIDSVWVKKGDTWRGKGDTLQIYNTKKRYLTSQHKDDSDKYQCWVLAPSNAIQYWQDQYAPLYQGEPLVTKRARNTNHSADELYPVFTKNAMNDSSGGDSLDIFQWWFSNEKQTPKIYNESPQSWNHLNFAYERWLIDKETDCCDILRAYLNDRSAPLLLSFSIFENGNRRSSHVVTLWGADFTTDSSGNEILQTVYITDTDREPAIMPFAVLYVDGIPYLRYDDSNNYEKMTVLRGFICLDNVDEMMKDYVNTSIPLQWTGKAKDKEWVASSAWYGDEAHLAEEKDGWKKACTGSGKTIYAHAYFTNENASNCCFEFGDSVGGQIVTNKNVVLGQALHVGSMKVSGTGYVFSGQQTLTADMLTITHGADLRLRDGVCIGQGTVVNIDGTLRVEEGSRIMKSDINMSSTGTLWGESLTLSCVGSASKDVVILSFGDYQCVSSDVRLSDCTIGNSGTLGCTIDMRGATGGVAFSGDSLEMLVYNKLGRNNKLMGKWTDYQYCFEIKKGALNATYDDIKKQPVALSDSSLTVDAKDNSWVTVASYAGTPDLSGTDINLSETSRTEVTAPQLVTAPEAAVLLNEQSVLNTKSFIVTANSSFRNEGTLQTLDGKGTVTVEKDATLSGSGTFSSVVSSGTLVVGSSPGAPQYESLTLNTGSTTVFYLDGTTPATSEEKGWGQGLHSVMSVLGDLVMEEGALITLGCSADFLNGVNIGESVTLTLIRSEQSLSDSLLPLLQTGTSIRFADTDDTLTDLADYGIVVRDQTWSFNADNTQASISLNFVSGTAGAVLFQGGAGPVSWSDIGPESGSYADDTPVSFYEGGHVLINGEIQPGAIVVSSAEDLLWSGEGSLTGSATLLKEDEGRLVLDISSPNYEGSVIITGGVLETRRADALGAGNVSLCGATLQTPAAHLNSLEMADDVTLLGGGTASNILLYDGTAVHAEDGFTLTDSGSLFLAGKADWMGDLVLSDASLVFSAGELSVTGTLTLSGDCELSLGDYAETGRYQLILCDNLSGDWESLAVSQRDDSFIYELVQEEKGLSLVVSSKEPNMYWGFAKGIWREGARFGTDGEGEELLFSAGTHVGFNGKAQVTISGKVYPRAVTVDSPQAVTFTADKKTAGSGIAGEAVLTKSGAGVLKLNAGNTYSGGTVLNAGTIKATAADSFGTGAITVKGGMLDLGGKAVANDIVLAGSATLKGDAKYAGAVIVEGDATLLAKTSYKGMTTIGSGSSLTLAEKVTMAGNLVVDGTLRVRDAKGLTMAKNQMLTLDNGGSVSGLVTIGSGSTLVWGEGGMSQAPVLKGGTLDLGAENSLTLTGSKAAVQLGEKVIDLPGKGIVYTDETLAVNSGTVTLNAVSGYAGSIEVKNGASLKLAGKEAVSNAITVSGNAAVVNGKTHVGDITVNGTLAKGTNITIADGRTVALNGAGVMLGTIAGAGTVDVNASIDATAVKLTAANINLNSGTFTNTKGIKLAKGQTLSLGGVTLNLGTKGALATAAGSTLVVSGSNTLSGSLTLGGGELVFAGGSLDVNGTLTLSKAMTVTGNGVITYGTLKPFKGDIAALFGGADVELDTETGTLTINGGATARLRTAAAPLATAAEAPVMAAALDAAPALLAMVPEPNPAADAMVQADWGILDANRAFAGAVNSRHQHAALLDKGRGVAWVSAFGSSVRHGNQGAHHGSDGTIEGAAFGLEHAVSDTASLGLAVGRSKNRLAATGVTHLRQETAHVALYGQKQLTHGFTADAAAAWGDTETKLGAASWSQKSAALTARLTHAKQLTDATAFRTFGGLTYEATDAGSLGATHTGSVQNLRAELGAGITHTAGKAHFYAEAALTGDLLRHNPTADLDGTRTHGANPGRLGIRATIGGLYSFTDTWNGTASYGIETESRSTSHTLNIGVSKTF